MGDEQHREQGADQPQPQDPVDQRDPAQQPIERGQEDVHQRRLLGLIVGFVQLRESFQRYRKQFQPASQFRTFFRGLREVVQKVQRRARERLEIVTYGSQLKRSPNL